MADPKPLHARLAAKLRTDPDGCWRWTGASTRNGYGAIGIGRRGDGTLPAHVASWLVHRGPVPKGMVLDHLCRHRECCNPWHLEPVTNAVNTRRGSKAKLTQADVEEIRHLWLTTPMTQVQIADRFEVHAAHVSRVLNRRRWSEREVLIQHRVHGEAA